MNMLPSVGRSEPLHNRGSKPSDGQVVKGKVIQLLNAEEAVVEINGRTIKATIEVPLKPGSSYLFQVFREADGFHLKMIKEVGAELTNNQSVDETVRFLGLPADGRSKALVRLFFQHDWPLKSALLMQARRLLDLSGQDGDFEALKMMLEKKWPLKESLFKALTAAQNTQASESLNTLMSELNGLHLSTPEHQELAALLKNWPSLDETGDEKAFLAALKTIGDDPAKEESLKSFLMSTFPEESETIHQRWPEARILLRKMATPQDFKAFLNLLGLSGKENQLLTSNVFGKTSDLWLKNLLLKTGFFYEAELRKLTKGQDVDTTALRQSLKGLLMALSQNSQDGGDTLHQTINHLLQHINGQQLQSLHMDRSFVQLLFTFPLRIQDELRDIRLFWEGKRNKDGNVDPNYCKIAFQLDLPHLNETVLHILVQERRVSVSVYNDHPLAEALIQGHSARLTEKLEAIGYNLVSVKQHMGSMLEAKAIFSPKAGSMDVKI